MNHPAVLPNAAILREEVIDGRQHQTLSRFEAKILMSVIQTRRPASVCPPASMPNSCADLTALTNTVPDRPAPRPWPETIAP